jgi:3-hydroxyisobutyrate dehydrogenase-like beta-hydroxyacid dehydrogenase
MTTKESNSKKVTVVGLGAMGSVLAKTLLSQDYTVTVWNRSKEKAEALAAEGAIAAYEFTAAINASPVIITCLPDYNVTAELIKSVKPSVQGKTFIEFTTGTPQDARNAEALFNSLGAAYLDGALLATPRQIGKPDTPIFISGSEKVFQTMHAMLKVLGGNIMYMGEPVGAAAAWDLGILSSMFGMMTGFFQGARIFETEGIAVNSLGTMITNIAPVLGEMIRHEGMVIDNNDYGQPESSLKTCAFTFDLLLKQAKEANIDGSIPAFMLQLFKQGVNAGFGDEQVGALMKVLRKNKYQ